MLQYAITDGTSPPPAPEHDRPTPHLTTLLATCTHLARNGVTFILVREKHLPAGSVAALTRHILTAVRAAAPARPPHILLSGRPDIALAAGADGVHLSSAPDELTPRQVRSILPAAIVSVSCHTLDDIRRARDQQASLALFAPIFGKSVAGSEVTPAAGLEALRTACQAAHPMPVFALGGVTSSNAPLCLAAGAAGIAGIRLFLPGSQTPGSKPDPK